MKDFVRKARVVYNVPIISSFLTSLFVIFALTQITPTQFLLSRLRLKRRDTCPSNSSSTSPQVDTEPHHREESAEASIEGQQQQITTQSDVKRSPEAIEYQRRLAQDAWEREQRFYEPDWD